MLAHGSEREAEMSDPVDGLDRPGENPPGGATRTPADILELSPLHRSIVQLVLRRREISGGEIDDAIRLLPEAAGLSQSELHAILDLLCEQRWLIREETSGAITYRITMQRRPAKPRPSRLIDSIDF
jgi:hypothetical protein